MQEGGEGGRLSPSGDMSETDRVGDTKNEEDREREQDKKPGDGGKEQSSNLSGLDL